MKRNHIGLALAALIALGAALILPSCGHDQRLVSMTLSPSGGYTFEGYGAQGTFTALGTFVHPPQTKDVTDQVTWSLDIANFGTITQTGQITYTRTDGCGSGLVTATASPGGGLPTGGSVVLATAPVMGVNNGNSSCGGGGNTSTLTVQVAGGNGTVTSNPNGISCPSTCIATFTVGNSILLTATLGTGSSSVGWEGCTTQSGDQCSITIPSSGATVTATFQ
jgi:hypothetical protein